MPEESTAVATVETPNASQNMLAIISNAVTDPRVDPAKMHSLLDVQERMMNKQAEIEFNNAMTAIQDEMPSITKDAKIKVKNEIRGTYASYENIDAALRPLMQKNGFSIRFASTPQPDGKILVEATLSHKGGHSIKGGIPLGLDTSGSKNNVQAAGSTITYGKRYLIQMFFNLVFEGQDDDGNGGDAYIKITDEHAGVIKDLIRQSGADTRKFLDAICDSAKSVDEMDERDFDKAKIALEAKMKKNGGGQ